MTTEVRTHMLIQALMIPSFDLGQMTDLFSTEEELLFDLTAALEHILKSLNTYAVPNKYQQRLIQIIDFMRDHASYTLLGDLQTMCV